MTKKQAERFAFLSRNLERLGISLSDQDKLRRIEMTLSRWGELECGDSNDYGSWAIERDPETQKPFRVHHSYPRIAGAKSTTTRYAIPDKEAGALKRLAGIMSKYPDLWAYHQTDPRGCSLYVGKKDDVKGSDLSSVYTRGVGVCI